MKNTRAKTCLATWILFLAACGGAYGQHWYHYAPPPTDFDWQLFAPVGDFSCTETPPAREGYFFDYGRMYFRMSRPNTVPIGNAVGNIPVPVYLPNEVDYAFYDINPGTPAQATNVLLPYSDGGTFGFQLNSIDDATPRTPDGYGNRVEFGWVQDRTGWMVSIISGLDIHQSFFYGFDDKRLNQLGAGQGLNGIDGVPVDNFTGTAATAPVAAVPGTIAIPHEDGLTTVHMFFDDPFNLLLGYADENADFVADDLNGDGVITSGQFPNGDRIRLGVVFDDVETLNRSKVSGVEVLAIRRKKELHSGATAEMFLGARWFQLDDRFRVRARGGILSDSEWQNDALNRIVGPEFGVRIAKRSRRWTTVISGRFTAGANFMSVRQDGVLGSHLTTSGLVGGAQATGIPLSFGGTDFLHTFRDERFSPMGDLRVGTSVHLTKAVTFNVDWQGIVAGGIARGANTIDYALPRLGIINRSEDIFTQGVTIGVEVNR